MKHFVLDNLCFALRWFTQRRALFSLSFFFRVKNKISLKEKRKQEREREREREREKSSIKTLHFRENLQLPSRTMANVPWKIKTRKWDTRFVIHFSPIPLHRSAKLLQLSNPPTAACFKITLLVTFETIFKSTTGPGCSRAITREKRVRYTVA